MCVVNLASYPNDMQVERVLPFSSTTSHSSTKRLGGGSRLRWVLVAIKQDSNEPTTLNYTIIPGLHRVVGHSVHGVDERQRFWSVPDLIQVFFSFSTSWKSLPVTS